MQTHSKNWIKRQSEVIEAYSRFINYSEGHIATEEEWESLMWLSFQLYDTYRPLTESTAASVLPAELIQTLTTLEEKCRAVDVITDLCLNAWQQYTVPIFLNHAPITKEEGRKLAYVQHSFKIRNDYLTEQYRLETEVLELLDTYNLGR